MKGPLTPQEKQLLRDAHRTLQRVGYKRRRKREPQWDTEMRQTAQRVIVALSEKIYLFRLKRKHIASISPHLSHVGKCIDKQRAKIWNIGRLEDDRRKH